MSHRLSYLVAQGQGGTRSGVSLGIPFSMVNPAAAAGAIPAASYPIEAPFWVAPNLIVADAFVTTLLDANPAANEPAPTFQIQAVRVTPNAAFAAAAASFIVDLTHRTAAGGAAQVIATLFDATVTTLAAFTQILVAAGFLTMPLIVGDSLNVRVRIQGGGAACPAFGGTVDLQG